MAAHKKAKLVDQGRHMASRKEAAPVAEETIGFSAAPPADELHSEDADLLGGLSPEVILGVLTVVLGASMIVVAFNPNNKPASWAKRASRKVLTKFGGTDIGA